MTLAPPPVRRPARPAGALLSAAAAGLAAGALTSWLQGVLPDGANWLADSGAVWTAIAFVAALAVGVAVRSAPVTVVAGVLCLVGEVAGYYAVASPLRDVATTTTERVLWTAAALVIGPAAGWAAHVVRTGVPAARAAALGGLGGVFAGEALHGLDRLHAQGQGWTELIVAAAVTAAGLVGEDRVRRLTVAVPVVVVVASVVHAAYGT